MSLREYFKEKILFIIISILMIIFSSALLKALKVDTYAIVFTMILTSIGSVSYYIYDFINRKKYYDNLLKNINNINKKYFISEIIDEGNFLESYILYSVIERCCKSMKDDINDLNRNIEEYKEYIEMWVHEIKTPIASASLLLENNYSDINYSVLEEINKIENLIEQVLFYAKSNDVNKDYIIRKINLRKCVNTVIRRNSSILIERKIKIHIEDDLGEVYCDNKWIEFILQQVVSNSIKYMDKEESYIKISSKKEKEKIILYIEDNGIGISDKSIEKVFEKGYTGESGRKFNKSTGIGLYLCKKLCLKLGLDIKITSTLSVGTRISIIFPLDKFHLNS